MVENIFSFFVPSLGGLQLKIFSVWNCFLLHNSKYFYKYLVFCLTAGVFQHTFVLRIFPLFNYLLVKIHNGLHYSFLSTQKGGDIVNFKICILFFFRTVSLKERLQMSSFSSR